MKQSDCRNKLAFQLGMDYGKLTLEERHVINDKAEEIAFRKVVKQNQRTITLAVWRGEEVWRRRAW